MQQVECVRTDDCQLEAASCILCQLEAPPLHEHLATLTLRSLGEIMTRGIDPWDIIPPYNSPHQPSPINSLCNVSHRSDTQHALFFTIMYQLYKLYIFPLKKTPQLFPEDSAY